MDVETPARPKSISNARAVPAPIRELLPSDVLRYIEQVFSETSRKEKVRVMGEVSSSIRGPAFNWCYFDVEAEGESIQVCVPELEAKDLSIGTHVCVEGELTVKAGFSSLHATISGHIIKQSRFAKQEPVTVVRDFGTLSLSEFIAKYEHGLVILGTGLAIGDLDMQLRGSDCYPGPFRREPIRITSSQDVLNAFRKASEYANGVMLVRGGDEEDSFEFWNDLEFIQEILKTRMHIYPGLGLADNASELDRYADEVFASPSAAGKELAKAWKTLQSAKKKIIPAEPSSAAQKSSPEVPRIQEKPKEISNATIWMMAFALGALVAIVMLYGR